VTVWEPWVPRVGQEVRVRLSGECAERWKPTDGRPRIEGHIDEVNGKQGVVIEVNRAAFESHPFLVRFERAITIATGPRAGSRITGACFAAIELDPVGGVIPA
jgi:hypothetical protein